MTVAHDNCPGTERTAYVRLERTRWVPVGLLCDGCWTFSPTKVSAKAPHPTRRPVKHADNCSCNVCAEEKGRG